MLLLLIIILIIMMLIYLYYITYYNLKYDRFMTNSDDWIINNYNSIFSIEWDYSMIFTKDYIGTVNFCYLNSNNYLNFIYKGGIYLCYYGYNIKENKPIECLWYLHEDNFIYKNGKNFEYIDNDIYVKFVSKNLEKEYTIKRNNFYIYYSISKENNNEENNILYDRWTNYNIIPQIFLINEDIVRGIVKGKICENNKDNTPIKCYGYHEMSAGCYNYLLGGWYFILIEYENISLILQTFPESKELCKLDLIYKNSKKKYKKLQFENLKITELEYKKVNTHNDKCVDVPWNVNIDASSNDTKIICNFNIDNISSLTPAKNIETNIFHSLFCLLFITGIANIEIINDKDYMNFEKRFGGEYAQQHLINYNKKI